MYTLCATEKTAMQQRQFEEAFIELLREYPYDTITISQLCRYAGLSRKIFYRLFERKSDVLYAAIDHIFLDFEDYMPDIQIVGRGGMHRFLGFWKQQKPLLDALSASKTSSLLAERAVLHVLQEGLDTRHSFGADSSPYGKESMIFYLTGLFALVLNWYNHGFDKTIDEMAAILMSLLMEPPIKNPLIYDPYK